MDLKPVAASDGRKTEGAHYKAFISYSHAADKKLAPALQSALQGFAKSWYQRRAMRVFRDDTNLSISPGLWSSIEAALSESEYFLFFACPRAANSKWVRKELDFWLKNRPTEKLLIILTDGNITWDPLNDDFDWEKTTALPDNLRQTFQEQPLYLDLRWCQTSQDVSLQNPHFRDRVADIAATLHDRPKDDLIGEDLRQHRRFVVVSRLVAVGLTALSIALTIAVVIAVWKRNEAMQSKIEAHARQLAAEAALLQDTEPHHFVRSILLGLESVRKLPTTAGTKVLRNALEILPQPIVRIEHEQGKAADVLDFAVSPDNRLLAAVISPTTIRLWRTSDWLQISNFNVERLGEHVVIRSIGFSPDGAYLSMGGDGILQPIWDVAMAKPVLEASDLDVRKAVFSPDGRYVLIGTMTGTIRIRSTKTWKEIFHINYGEDIQSIDFSADGRRVAISGLHVDVYSVGSWQRIMRSPRFETYAYKIRLGPKGRYLAVVTHGKSATIFDVDERKEIHRISHSENVWDIDFSEDGKYVATAGGDGSAAIWFVGTDRELRLPYETGVSRVSFCSLKNVRLITASGQTARVWQLPEGVEVARITSDFSISAIAAIPGYNYIVAGSYREAAAVFRLTGARQGARIKHDGEVRAISFSPNNRYFVTGGGQPPLMGRPPEATSLRVFNLENADEVFSNRFADDVEHIRFSPDGQYLAAGSSDEIRIWSITEWKEIVRIEHLYGQGDLSFPSSIFDLEFSPNGQLLSTASRDKTARIWEIPSGRELARLEHGSNVFTVDFNLDGRKLATGSLDGTARVWDLEGSLLWRFPIGEKVSHVLFANDGRELITASDDGTVRLWDLANGRQTFRITHQGLISDITLSEDGRFLATASWDRTARIADLFERRVVATISHAERVSDVSFDSSGHRLATASDDGSARVWAIPNCEEIASFNHGGRVSSAIFTRNGRLLATAGDDGIARLWLLSPKEIMDEICSHLSRNLTLDEWNRYMGEERYQKSCNNLPVHESFVNWGMELAKTATLDSVIAHYRRVAELDPGRQLDPDQEARSAAAKTWITRSLEAAELGQIEQALSALDQASDLNPEIVSDVSTLNNLCWKGALHGRAQEVLHICDQAVALANEDILPKVRDSRGVARALTGNFTGAIEDLGSLIEWTHYMDSQNTVTANWNRKDRESMRAKRRQWILELEAGRNPFGPSELETLRLE